MAPAGNEPTPLSRPTRKPPPPPADCRPFVVRNVRVPGAGLLRQCIPEQAVAWSEVVAGYTDALAPMVISARHPPSMAELTAVG